MKFTSQKPELPGFQITPMLDVVFLLLCFFVTTSVFSRRESEIDVQMPTADSGSLPESLPGEVVFNVDREGAVRVNGRTLSDEAIADMCRTLAKVWPGNPVVVRGDRDARYADVIRVVDICSQNDVYAINFAVGRREDEAAANEPAPAAIR